MDPVIFIELAIADIEPLVGFGNETELLTSSYRFRTHTVLGFCAPDVIKTGGVSGIFNDIPRRDYGWGLEIAVELVDLLPDIDLKSEAILDVKGADGVLRKLCLSNRMSRLYLADQQLASHVLLPRTKSWHGIGEVLTPEGERIRGVEEQLRTVAAMQFAVDGDTAEHAFESSISTCLDILFASVNMALRAVRECRKGFSPVTRTIRRDSVPAVYVLMKGAGKAGATRLALNAARVGLIPEEFDREQANRFRALLDGSEPLGDVDQLLGEARSSYEDGEYEFAFLQAVIAAEIATARGIRTECLNRGVSKNKLADNRKEMTYSWALNIGLPLCYSPERRPDSALIAAMNTARSKRNDLMHEGIFDINREQLGQLLNDTKAYVAALGRV